MRQVTLSDSLLSTSRLGFGTASLHHLTRSSARQELLASAWDAGIRHFDTAPLYGHELAETELGTFLRSRRDEVTIATKVGIEPSWMCARYPQLIYPRLVVRAGARRLGLVPASRTYRRQFDARRVDARVRRSLRLLKTDYIDVLFLHEPALSQITDPDGLIHVLEDLRAAGLVKYIGLSGYAKDCLPIAMLYPALASILQLDVRSLPQEYAAASRALAAPVTFGHFRNATGDDDMLTRLRSAVQQNKRGCILYSTRSPSRVQRIATALETIDAA